MSDLLNNLSRVGPNLQVALGRIVFTAGVPGLTLQSGEGVDTSQVTIADTSTGVVTFTIANFKGAAGACLGFGAATTAGYGVSWGAATYSGDTATIVANVTTDAAAANDDNFNFLIVAF